MSPLDRKLMRDLWRMKGQATAIALVIAVGTLLLVMMNGLVNTLNETRDAYYQRYRLADVFAPVVRAPSRVLEDIAALPGVGTVEGRVVGGALIDMPGVDLPVRAQAISLPENRRPALNDIYLSGGRMLDGDGADEVLVLNSFAKAHGLVPGDVLDATMNGARREFTIVGIAQSPEFIYTPAPGEMMPDDARFAVLWLNEAAMMAAYDMEGAFNEALVSLGKTANQDALLAALDRLLDPYGSRGAFGIEDQISHRFVSEEIKGLEQSSASVPPVFMAVAAFLLFIVISRMVQSEREEIGLLKAFGYSSLEVSLHYFKFALIIATAGTVVGSLMGIASGRAMAGLYLVYFKFPFMVFQLDPGVFVTGLLTSILAASAGAVFVLRSVFALTPAVAMRPPAPADYSRTATFGPFLRRVLDQPTRMVLRRMMRQPGRMFGAVIGIATGMALAVSTGSLLVAFDRSLDIVFSVIDRSDATISFVVPMPPKAIYEIKQIDGVVQVEPMRAVPVVLRNGLRTHRGAISGLVSDPVLNRALDADVQPIDIREDGIILAEPLAEILQVVPGDNLTVEVREGRRPVLTLPVIDVAQSLLGSPVYMNVRALNRALRQSDLVSGAFLRIDAAKRKQVFEAVKNMPAVAGISLKENAYRALKRQMDSGAGATRFVMAAVAAVITFGIVYNSARIAFAERTRDLASLRVIGFTRAEAAYVLLGEIGLITLVAVPLGAVMGYFLSVLISEAYSTDLYQIPAVFAPTAYGFAAITVLVASVASGWLVKRDLDRIDLVLALKTRE